MLKFVITFCAFFLISSITSAQEFSIYQYRAGDGLSTDLIKSVAQDDLGFIWIGSDDGLIRYDGLNFTKFPQATSSGFIKHILKLSNGNLWAVHDLGIVEIENTEDTVVFKTILSGSVTKNDSMVWYPKRAFEDSRGNVWISEPQSVIRYHDGDFERYEFGLEDNSISFVRSFNLFQPDDSYVLIASYTGNFYKYEFDTNSIIPLTLIGDTKVIHSIRKVDDIIYVGGSDDAYELTISDETIHLRSLDLGIQVSDIIEIDDGSILFCAEDSESILIRRDKQGKVSKLTATPEDLSINQAFKDREGIIWLSTLKGLCLLQKPEFTKVELGPNRTFVEAIISRPTSNDLYLMSKEWLWKIDKSTNMTMEVRNYPGGYFLSGVVNDDGLWISNEFDLWHIVDGVIQRKLSFAERGRYIFDVFCDQEGIVWLSQEASLGVTRLDPGNYDLTIYDEDVGLNENVAAIHGNDYGVYLATNNPNAYLYRKPIGESQFINIAHQMSDQLHEGFAVNDMELIGDSIYLATTKGIFLHDWDSLRHLSFNSDIDELSVSSIIHHEDQLWFGNSVGLYRYNLETNEYFHFNESTGLPINAVVDEGIYLDEDKVWIGTTYGLAYKNIIESEIQMTSAPKLLQILVNGVERSFSEELEFTVSSFFTIRYSSMSFPQNQIMYSYRLPGLGEKWSNPLKTNELQLSDLPVGEYQLEIRAKKEGDYYWSDPTALSFSVKPAFFQTIYFYLAIVLLVIFFSFLSRYITRRLMKQRQLQLEETVADRTKELNEYKDNLEELVHQRTNELEETQSQLVQAEKMASLGTLTAGVAHEINNPVNYLQAGLYGLETLLSEIRTDTTQEPLKHEILEVAQNMQFGVDRITKIVSSLSHFSRKDGGEKQNCNIHEIIDNCLMILSHEIKDSCDIQKLYADGQVEIQGEEGSLHQLFINLISNAVHAMDGRGVITIQTKRTKRGVIVSVEDTGKGIPEVELNKLFDPFYTTKAPGEGTGLGLYISLKVAKAHNAELDFQSTPGIGTKVTCNFLLI